MSNVNQAIVREIPIFSSLGEKQLDYLLNMAHLQIYPENTRLVDEGDHAQFLIIVLDGMVELFCSSSTREATMFVLKPISAFNLSAVLADTVYSMSAVTKIKTKVLMIPAKNIREMVKNDASFAQTMIVEIANRYRVLIDAFREQRLCSSVERLAKYLLRSKEHSATGLQIQLTEDKRTLAALLGMSPEHLSRAFRVLKDYGVESQGGRIRLTNLEKLRNFSDCSRMIDILETEKSQKL